MLADVLSGDPRDQVLDVLSLAVLGSGTVLPAPALRRPALEASDFGFAGVEGVPVALVSSSRRSRVEAFLSSSRLNLDVTVAGDEVPGGEPYLEPHLTAAAARDVP